MSGRGRRSVRVIINGEPREVSDTLTLSELVHELALAPERLAIEHNREVVRRSEWQNVQVKEGDRIEIVHFVGGGNL